MRISSNVWKLYAQRFFSSLIPAYVIERLYWEQRGMTVEMVVYTEIIYAVTIVLLEVPTGILADRLSRKALIVAGAAMGCCEFALLLGASQFWHFALVVFLAGIGRSAASGSENALLYETLAQLGKPEAFEKQLGRLNAFDLAGTMLAALCGGLLAARFPLALNYWLSLGSAVVSLAFACWLTEPAAAADREEPGEAAAEAALMPVREYVRASLLFFRNRPGVRFVLLAGMLLGASISFIDEFWQLYVGKLGVPVGAFGLVSTCLFLLRMPGSLLAYKLKGRFSSKGLLASAYAAFAVGFACMAWLGGWGGLAAMALVCLFAGIVEPLCAGYLHHRIDSSMRATLDSFQSLGVGAATSLVGLGFGYFSSQVDVSGGYGFLAVVCAAFFLYTAGVPRKVTE
ncbi:MFS transporter [Paenibacillus athensensis]|uniref:MFS transporter n=1 Tax=Paenibacillus athensensis TaxID=1967502 RepID=A0A4Y8Q3Y5_9BACL|nr:MFS transporter [Paenibacillus athensensis]MCD1259258.1 MFS transporter [Paenibacillus athensensis]